MHNQAEFAQLRDADSGAFDLESFKAYLIACPKEVQTTHRCFACIRSPDTNCDTNRVSVKDNLVFSNPSLSSTQIADVIQNVPDSRTL